MRRRRQMLTNAGGTRAWAKTVKHYIGIYQVCWLRLPGCTIRSQTIDHYHTRKARPDLAEVPANYRPACHHCNRARRDTPPHLIPALRAKMEAAQGRQRPSKALRFFG